MIFLFLKKKNKQTNKKAVSGLPEECRDQARCIARLALDMMELALDVLVDGVPVVSNAASVTTALLNAGWLTVAFLSDAANHHRYPLW